MSKFYTEEEVNNSQNKVPVTGRFIDITGDTYSKLTVIKFYKRETKHSYWFCRCNCGSIVHASTNSLRVGNSKQCSTCSSKEFSAKLCTPNAELILNLQERLPTKYTILSTGKRKDQHAKIYCTSCHTNLSSPYDMIIKKGYIPCRCKDSVTPFTQWTEELRVDQINTLCQEKNFELISPPTDNKVTGRIDLSCNKCKTVWNSSVGNFCNGGYGCPKCGRDKTEKGVKRSLEYYIKTYPKEGYNYDKAEYSLCTEHIEIVCEKHGSFFQSPDNHFRGGRGCPSCTKGGFNKMKSGILYILSVNEEVIKFGITNHTTEKRMAEIQSKTKQKLTILYEKYFQDGVELYNKEREIMNTFVTGVVSKSELMSGYTETTYSYNLNNIIRLLSE
tara:strand:+ start:100 stop:1263 length:1164 start_codon:yes stop_codon:yes gene_type:complete